MNHNAHYADPGSSALPLHLLDRDGYGAWRSAQPAAVSAWLLQPLRIISKARGEKRRRGRGFMSGSRG